MLEDFGDFVISMLLLGEIMTRYIYIYVCMCIYIYVYIYMVIYIHMLFKDGVVSTNWYQPLRDFSVRHLCHTAKLRPWPFRASCSSPVVGQR